MNIDLNEFFRLRVDIIKVRNDLYRLRLESVFTDSDPKSGMHNSHQEFYLNDDQLKTFRNYINEVTNDLK